MQVGGVRDGVCSSSSSIFNVNIITPTSRGDILRQIVSSVYITWVKCLAEKMCLQARLKNCKGAVCTKVVLLWTLAHWPSLRLWPSYPSPLFISEILEWMYTFVVIIFKLCCQYQSETRFFTSSSSTYRSWLSDLLSVNLGLRSERLLGTHIVLGHACVYVSHVTPDGLHGISGHRSAGRHSRVQTLHN